MTNEDIIFFCMKVEDFLSGKLSHEEFDKLMSSDRFKYMDTSAFNFLKQRARLFADYLYPNATKSIEIEERGIGMIPNPVAVLDKNLKMPSSKAVVERLKVVIKFLDQSNTRELLRVFNEKVEREGMPNIPKTPLGQDPVYLKLR